MILTSQAVNRLMRSCLADKDDLNPIKVEGIINTTYFNRVKIAEHTVEIVTLLAELPDPFHQEKGGGWSFLQACVNRHGDEWTGLHVIMEALFCLGIAADKVRWMMPRDVWTVLPGGMPYVVVLP